MEKIKVKKDVYESLNFIMEDSNFSFYKNEYNELKKEELVECHNLIIKGEFDKGVKYGIELTLDKLNIKIKGINS